MKKKKFTLIELLVVIVIITILVGILIPAAQTVRVRAQAAKAKSGMTSIYTAIKAYEGVYGYLPSHQTLTTVGNTSNYTEYRNLMVYLSGFGSNTNPRKTKFLEVPSTFSETKGSTALSNTKTGAVTTDYYDPWNNLYQIYLDTGYDGSVTVGNLGTLKGSIFIYSLGPNRNDDGGKNKQFGEGTAYDDVCQWR